MISVINFWGAGILALRELLLATVHGTPWRLPLPQPSFALLIPTYHPAYLLRNPSAKRQVWEDMKAVRAKLQELNSSYYGS